MRSRYEHRYVSFSLSLTVLYHPLASYPGLPMFFNVSREKSRETLKNMGRPGYEATIHNSLGLVNLEISRFSVDNDNNDNDDNDDNDRVNMYVYLHTCICHLYTYMRSHEDFYKL